MQNTDTSFVFSDWFQTAKALTLPVAFQTPTFANNFSTTVPSWLHVVTVADFNGDNLDDVVLSLTDSMRAPYILISQGDGSFRIESNFAGDAQRQFIRNGTTADLNKDGWVDFVGFESTHSMQNQKDLILINNGGQGFSVAPSPLPPTDGHHGGAVGDFNGDGLVDVFGIREFGYPNYGGADQRAPLIQQSNGTWKLASGTLPASFEAYGLAAATMSDLNGDGHEDLILGVSIMAKDQSGIALTYERIAQTPTLIIGYAEPGKALSNWRFETVGQHWADAATYASFVRSFGTPGTNATAGANSLAVMDINQDGKADIIAGSYLTEGFSHRTGGFQAFINTGSGFVDQTSVWFPNQLANRDFAMGFNFLYSLSDLNADGNKDLIVTTPNSVNWLENSKYGTYPSLFIGQGGSYAPARVENMRVFENSVVGAYQITNAISGDFNGDGIPDLISLRNESDFYWNSPDLQSRTGYVVVSHLNKGLVNDQRSGSTAVGTSKDDILKASANLPMLRGLAGNDVLQGSVDLLSTAIYHGTRSDFLLSSRDRVFSLKDLQGNEGTDELHGISRVAFSDVSLGLDLQGNSGIVSKTLGAVFGPSAILNKEYAGIGLHFVDQLGFGYPALIELAINARLGANPTHTQVVDLLYTNVVGQAPDAATRKSFTDLLDAGVFNVASLGVLAADTELNKTNINLVGLAQTGLAYVPFEG